MAGKGPSSLPPWLAPALSAGLAAAAFLLAWLHGWPWGAFLLAEVLALMALAAAFWPINEGHPWWAYPALLIGLVVLVFSGLYLGGRLDLAGAVQAGSSVVLAFFTITLWRSTQTQAEATKGMKDLQNALSRAELTPLVVIDSIMFLSWPELINVVGQKPDKEFNLELEANKWCYLGLCILNGGKYPVVKLEVSALIGSGEIDSKDSKCLLEKADKIGFLLGEGKVCGDFFPRNLLPGKLGFFVFKCKKDELAKIMAEAKEMVLTLEFEYGGEPGNKQVKLQRCPVALMNNKSCPECIL